MNNKYVYMIVAGIALFGWYWVGYEWFENSGNLTTGYIMAAVLALALGAGNSDGDDLISTLMGSVTSFIPKLIALVVAVLIATVVDVVLVSDMGFHYHRLIEPVTTVIASTLLIALTMGCLKKAG